MFMIFSFFAIKKPGLFFEDRVFNSMPMAKDSIKNPVVVYCLMNALQIEWA